MKFIIALTLLVSSVVFGQSATVRPITNYTGRWITVSTTIPQGTTFSAPINLAGYSVVGIEFPTAMTGTAVTFVMAATLTDIYVPVYNASGQVSYTIAGTRYYAINPADLDGIQYLKIVSGTAESAPRTLTVTLKGKQ